VSAARVVAAAALGLLLVAGCSNATPMPGENGPTDTGVPSATLAPPVTTSASALPGLSDDCTTAVHAQVAISTLFARAVDGKPLTAAAVAAVFTPLQRDVPAPIADDVIVLHEAATASLGKKPVVVANTLNSAKVSTAMSAVNDYVKSCTPTTS
jgi:hypothetical protein